MVPPWCWLMAVPEAAATQAAGESHLMPLTVFSACSEQCFQLRFGSCLESPWDSSYFYCIRILILASKMKLPWSPGTQENNFHTDFPQNSLAFHCELQLGGMGEMEAKSRECGARGENVQKVKCGLVVLHLDFWRPLSPEVLIPALRSAHSFHKPEGSVWRGLSSPLQMDVP